MHILGVVGSPRKEKGLTHKTVAAALNGARQEGASTDILYLRDFDIQYCIHCGYDCFQNRECKQQPDLTSLFRELETTDALVLGAPVYIWQVNGLTVSFFDKFRMTSGPWSDKRENSRPALGIAVAGGTGTGVFPALQSIYSWLCVWEFQPLTPLPVTRFNLESALEKAEKQGKKLVSNNYEIFTDTAELITTYDNLPFMNYTHKDEFRWLAEKIIENLEKTEDDTLAQPLKQLKELLQAGNIDLNNNQEEAARKYIKAYHKARTYYSRQKGAK